MIWRSSALIGVLCLAVGLAFAQRAETAPPVPPPKMAWQFVVAMSDLDRGMFDVTMTVRGASGDLRLCLYMDSAERELSEVRRITSGPPIKEDTGCYVVPAVQPQGVTLSYKYDLRALSERKESPDYAERIGGTRPGFAFANTYIWNDQAVLFHPVPLPDDVNFDVELRLPAGVPYVTPWPLSPNAQPGGPPRFRESPEQHDGGSYITMGPLLRDLGPLPVNGGQTTARLHILELPHRASDAALRKWLGEALGAVSSFYGDLISRQISIVLMPIGNNSEPGVFGTVLRQDVPSAVIYFGADCTAPAMHDDWLAIHELFHVGNPLVSRKIPWLVEGFTTYYQDVLRARAHALTSEEAWSDLYDGFRRHCQPRGGRSLDDESQALYRNHSYSRVYWGGGCLAFVADAAIRARTQGKRSLDDVMFKLRKQSLHEALDEETVLEALDSEAGGKLISNLLHDRRSVPFEDWLRRLGVIPTGSTTVRLVDTAPLSALRRNMF